MAFWRDTHEAADFVASADSRNTSREIMLAIAFFARNEEEAEAIWRDGPDGVICHPSDIWEVVTGNGLRDATEFCWGVTGSQWWKFMSEGS